MTGGKYIKLAQQAARHFVMERSLFPIPVYLPSELQRQQACYVTIYEDPGRRFRAMHGTPLPTTPTLGQEIIRNTAAALEHETNRFLRQADLNDFHFEVAVLGPLERIGGPEHLDPKRFGAYVRSDRGKSAVILPHRVGVETAEEQFATVIRESNINPQNESATFYRFAVVYYA